MTEKVIRAEALIEGCLKTNNRQKSKEWLDELAGLQLPMSAVRAIVRYGRLTNGEVTQKGEFQTRISIPGYKGTELPLVVRVPDTYGPGVEWPLIIASAWNAR